MRGMARSLARRVLGAVLSIVMVLGPALQRPAFALAEGQSEPASAEASAPVVVREIVESRTASSREYLMSNGLTRVEYFGEPVNYYDSSLRRWNGIDSRLETVSVEGRHVLRNKADSFSMQLPDKLGDARVTVTTGAGRVQMSPARTNSGVPARPAAVDVPCRSASATAVVYDDAFDVADLEYESGPGLLKETILLSAPTSATAFGFDLDLDGFTPRQEKDGSISLLREDGALDLAIVKPCMWDSSEDPGPNDFTDAVRYELLDTPSGWRLSVVADADWLSDPSRVYPVRVDPTIVTSVSATAETGDTYVSSGAGNTNYVGSTLMNVNDHDATYNYTEYSYLKPGSVFMSDLADKKAEGNVVVGGNLRVVSNITGVDSGYVSCVRCTTIPNLNTVTWNTGRPSTTSSQAAPSVYINAANTQYHWNITDMVRYWQDQGDSAACVRLATGTDGARMGFKSEQNTGTKPKWTVEYAPIPEVTLTSPTTGGVVATPTVSWVTTESLTNGQVEYEVQLSSSTSGSILATCGAATSEDSCALPVPPGGFDSGVTYYVRVRAATSPHPSTPRLWSEWTEWGDFQLVPPNAVEGLSATSSASTGWFVESDTNGDGRNDALNDSDDQGRGAVQLSWQPSSGATGYRVYMFDGNEYRQVATSTATAWSSEGEGIFPSDSQIASLPLDTSSNPLLSGDGLELRDDPRPLYEKTAGETVDDRAEYRFRVAPFNDRYSRTATESAEVSVVLDNRTTHLNEDPRHTVHQLGDFALHSGEVVFDKGSLRLSVTDLSINSWGPVAQLSRVYDSTDTTRPAYLGHGWRFNFEQRIETATATYVDELGDRHHFEWIDGEYVAPNGYYGCLRREFVGIELGYRLSEKDGSSILFGPDGMMINEADNNGNTVCYDWMTPGELSIWAANGNRIRVAFEGSRIATATYGTPDGTRTVLYSELADAGWGSEYQTCTYFPGTDDQRTVRYDYDLAVAGGEVRTFLTDLMVEELPAQTFHFEALPFPTEVWKGGHQFVALGGAGNTGYLYLGVTVLPETSPELGLRTGVYERYQWNSNGTMSAHSNRHHWEDSPDWNRCEYGPGNEVTRETDAMDGSKQTRYDDRGNVVAEIDERGNQTSYVYGTEGGEADRVIQETNPLGGSTDRSYDASGNLVLEEQDLTATSRSRAVWSYDSLGRKLSEERRISETESATTTFEYGDISPEPESVTQVGVKLSPSSQPVSLTDSIEFDAFGNVTSRTNARGLTIETCEYSDGGLLLESQDASGTRTVHEYDSLGKETLSYRTDGSKTIDKVGYTYGYYGQLSQEKHYDGSSVVYTITNTTNVFGNAVTSAHSIEGTTTRWFNANGEVVREWGPDCATALHGTDAGAATRNFFDEASHLIWTVAPGRSLSEGTTNTVDAAGRTAHSQNPDGSWVRFEYDAVGNQVRKISPAEDGGTVVEASTYDLAGRLTVETEAMGTPEESVTTREYDLLGRDVGSALGEAQQSRTYNSLGWVTQEIDGDGIAITRTFDELGGVTAESVGGRITTSVYEANGRLASQTDPAGRTTAYEYDPFGRITSKSLLGAGGKTTRTSYDSLSRPTTVTVSSDVDSALSVTTVEAYADALSRIGTRTIEYAGSSSIVTLDPLGRDVNRSIAAGSLVASRVVELRDLEGNPLSWKTNGVSSSATYDGLGKLTSQGGLGWGGGATYTSDSGTGRKTAETLSLAYAPASYAASYTYDVNGRLSKVVSGTVNWSYSFDSAGNLASGKKSTDATSTFFTYSPASNRLLNSRTGSSVTTYTFDSLGRRVNQGPLGNSRETTFTFDDASRMVGFSRGVVRSDYTYDAEGQRLHSSVTSGGMSTETTYTYDGLNLLSISATSDNATYGVTYFYDEADRPFAARYSASNLVSPLLFHLVTNDRGDVIELTDASGNAFGAYRYDAWGSPLASTARTAGSVSAAIAQDILARQPLRYAGYAYDAESSMYYCSQRYYDPATGAFISKDPAQADGEESAYQYCGGDPVDNTDPTGLLMWVTGTLRKIWGNAPFRRVKLKDPDMGLKTYNCEKAIALVQIRKPNGNIGSWDDVKKHKDKKAQLGWDWTAGGLVRSAHWVLLK